MPQISPTMTTLTQTVRTTLTWTMRTTPDLDDEDNSDLDNDRHVCASNFADGWLKAKDKEEKQPRRMLQEKQRVFELLTMMADAA
jgi:hypothetical protein